MMRTIDRANAFKRDFKRESKGQYRKTIQEDLREALKSLLADIPLDPKYRDHDLVGNLDGYRECHIKPDLLLIYSKPTDDLLWLARLGSHSELF